MAAAATRRSAHTRGCEQRGRRRGSWAATLAGVCPSRGSPAACAPRRHRGCANACCRRPVLASWRFPPPSAQRAPGPSGQRPRTARPRIPDILDEPQNAPICVPQLRSVKGRTGGPNERLGGSARGYQRDLRDVGSQQTGGRLKMQPSGLMNIYASPSCPENARFCRIRCGCITFTAIGSRRSVSANTPNFTDLAVCRPILLSRIEEILRAHLPCTELPPCRRGVPASGTPLPMGAC